MSTTVDQDIAITNFNRWGRRYYRGMVSFQQLDCARSRAWNRLRSSRNPQVRDAANDLLAFSGTFRSFRYLSSAPMSEIEILASHPTIRRNYGR